MTAGRVDPADGATRVLVADDHPAFRAGLRALLETASDVVVVGEADSGEAAVTAARTLHPDVVLMDINMPGIALTMHDDDETVFAAVRAGARG